MGTNKKDTLDYSAYSSPVQVTLGINNQITATGVGGTILSIENLIGGTSGDNNLIGANTVNSWNITDTNSGNISDITFSGFQKLQAAAIPITSLSAIASTLLARLLMAV
jgi:hypothetical protein